MSKMAFVVNSMSGGGAEKSAFEIVSRLNEIDFKVDLIAINSSEIMTEEKAFVIELQRDRKSGFLSTLTSLRSFRKVVSLGKYKKLILNCDLPELFGIFVPKEVEIVLVEHANPPWSNRKLLGRMVRILLGRRNITYVVVSRHLTIWPNRKVPTTLIPNPIEPISQDWKFEAGNRIERLVFVGRLSSLFKRPDLLLNISSRLGLPCLFLGSGDLYESLKKKSIERGVGAEYAGFVKNPWSRFSLGDLLIIPSTAEGDGLVLVEAVQHDVPFLATDIPDLNKYGISSKNYCQDEESFIARISEFSNRLNELVVKSPQKDSILMERDLGRICKAWIDLLGLIHERH
jgi:hypothetical protein